MKYRPFGTTGQEVSFLILGSWLFGGGKSWGSPEDKTSIETIHAAIDAGITMIDTAEAYGGGHSEEVVGAALKGRRDEMRIATKLNTGTPGAEVKEHCEGSLRRLRTDYIDLYQVHWPSESVPVEQSIEALAELREQGKIRWIGVSNFSAEQMAAGMKIARIESLQPPYNLFWRHIEASVLPFAREHDMAVIPYSPLAQGLLTGKYGAETRPPADDVRSGNVLFKGETYRVACEGVAAMRSIAGEIGCTLAQLALAWLIAQPGVTAPIVGARNPEQLAGTVPAVDVRLTESHLSRLSEIGNRVMATLDENHAMWR